MTRRAFLGVLLIVVSACACMPFGRKVSMSGPIHIVMSPDGRQFAFSVNVRPFWAPGPNAWNDASFGLSEFVGIWTYDLALRTGPRRVARWSHASEWSPRLVAWSEDGL